MAFLHYRPFTTGRKGGYTRRPIVYTVHNRATGKIVEMRALIIGETEKQRIKEAVERARARPVLIDTVRAGAIDDQDKDVVTLEDRKPGFERPASEHVLIPHGYRAAVSFEQQPAGMCRHLSISVDTPGKMPSQEAAMTIAAEFGFTKIDHGWVEEFDPGHHAINLLELVAPTPEGHA